ncbi:2-thiouracil desulfurase family protein [Thiomicrolovo sp. ZZH C-3]
MIVSACLLGEKCRYDGATKKDDGVLASLADKEVIPFCPEAPVLGTPRGRISVIATEDHGLRVRKDADGTDVTDALIEQTEALIKAHPDATGIILKSKSPSCGIGTTPVLDEAGNEIAKGNGVAADLLLHAFPDISIVDENSI